MTGSTSDGRVVDLSLLLAEELPCTWPGHMPYQQKTFNYFAEGGPDEAHLVSPCGDYQTRWLLADEHTGTHVDAPAHFIPRTATGLPDAGSAGAITVEQIPLTQCMGPAVVIDVGHLVVDSGVMGSGAADSGISPIIGPEHVEEFESEHGPIGAGDIVLFRSGWDRHYLPGPAGRRYAHDAVILKQGEAWPAPSSAAIAVLIERGVRCVGTDGPSMGSAHDGRDVHVTGLGQGCVFVEALANLAELPVRGAQFVFAPIKVARGTGAPGRAFAVVPTDS